MTGERNGRGPSSKSMAPAPRVTPLASLLAACGLLSACGALDPVKKEGAGPQGTHIEGTGTPSTPDSATTTRERAKGNGPSAPRARRQGERNEAPPVRALKRAKRIIVDVSFLDGSPFSFAAASETPRSFPTHTVRWQGVSEDRSARPNPERPTDETPTGLFPVRSLADVGNALLTGRDVTLAPVTTRRGESGAPFVGDFTGTALDLLPRGEVAPLRADAPGSHVLLAFVASHTLVLLIDPHGNGKDSPTDASDAARCKLTDLSFDLDAAEEEAVSWSLVSRDSEQRERGRPADDEGTAVVERPFDPASQCVPAGNVIAARVRAVTR